MPIVVTGASGHLGRSVVESLLERGVDPATITATGRREEPLAELAGRGVRTLRADYGDAAALDAAFAGADRVLLVSGLEPDRLAQHRTVVDAAVRAGVGHLVYTSAPKAATTSMKLAADHRATEEYIAASGLPATILRNAWYVENYTAQLPTYVEHGMVGAAGDGRVSVALRREYGAAAAAVLAGTGHEGQVYELGGDAVTLADIAAAVSAASGRQVAYTDVPEETLRGILGGAGLPEPVAAIFADVDRAIAAGELDVEPTDLTKLLGHPPTPLRAAAEEALQA
jgi:NAD(P)H dehydrogenase (quinone)